jgi:UDP-glucose 4-epimerase
MHNQTVLITGGAGYIGSVVADELKSIGYKIIIIDDLSEGNVGSISKDIIFVESDFGNQDVLEKIYLNYKIDIIIHLAAKANVPDSVINPSEYYQNNVSSTLSLLNFAVRNKINKIIFSSTAAVYGNPLYTPMDENHPVNPVNPYGWSKLFCEQIIKDYSKAYDLSYVIFRYFCAAGAAKNLGESRKKETHIIPLIIEQLISNKDQFQVYGTDFETKDGTGVRDFIHVLDIAKAHILCIKSFEKVRNNIFNLGNTEGYSVMDVISFAERLLSKNLNYKFSARRQGDPPTLIASNECIYNTLGWKPEFSMEDIINTSYEWQKNKLY